MTKRTTGTYNKGKRKPVKPLHAKSNKHVNGHVNSTLKNKQNNRTVFNSNVDNKLKTEDPYHAELNNGTINSLYKFATTMDINSINKNLNNGLTMLKNINGYINDAIKIKDELSSKEGVLNALGEIAPSAKSYLRDIGIKESIVDNIIGAAHIGVEINGAYKKIKSGDMDLLTGLNNIGKSLTGHDIAVIKDMQALKTTYAAIIKEFSNVGIAIKESWDILTKRKDKNGNQEYDFSSEIANAILPDMGENGDYETILFAINSSGRSNLEGITEETIRRMISNFSLNSVFNKNKSEVEIFNSIMKVIMALKGNTALWIDRGNGSRKIFNLKLFANCSEDFKTVARIALAKRFYLENIEGRNTITQYGYDDSNNELKILALFLVKDFNYEREFRKDFPYVRLDEKENTIRYIDPSLFNTDISTIQI